MVILDRSDYVSKMKVILKDKIKFMCLNEKRTRTSICRDYYYYDTTYHEMMTKCGDRHIYFRSYISNHCDQMRISPLAGKENANPSPASSPSNFEAGHLISLTICFYLFWPVVICNWYGLVGAIWLALLNIVHILLYAGSTVIIHLAMIILCYILLCWQSWIN